MTLREASLETSAAPERVWRVWSDVNSWPEWNPDMKDSRLDAPLQVGTRGMINTSCGADGHRLSIPAPARGRTLTSRRSA
jgi:uncharacterized protein YndB with AHSA1/START domain